MRVSDPDQSRRIAVIGAGLAGAAVCARFAACGWSVDLIDAHAAPARGASGNHAASFHPLIARDNNRMVRLIRAGITTALAHWQALEHAGYPFSWAQCGALQLSRAGAKQDVALTLAALDLEPAFVRAVNQHEASAIAGVALRAGGVLFGQGGWVQPASLITAQLASCGRRLTTHFGRQVARADRSGAAWTLIDIEGQSIVQAPVVVLACGADASLPRLFGQQDWPIDAVAGQISVVNANSTGPGWPAPQLPVHGSGYVLPCIEDKIVVGATYDRHGMQTVAAGHRHNFAEARRMLAMPLPVDADTTAARISLRAVARDRLPVIGALPDIAAVDARAVLRAGAQLANLPRLPGVYAAAAYGSRGLTWAALGAQLLLAMLEGGPMPVERSLKDAVDPGRFALRAVRSAS